MQHELSELTISTILKFGYMRNSTRQPKDNRNSFLQGVLDIHYCTLLTSISTSKTQNMYRGVPQVIIPTILKLN